jgi:hypothetical protein
MGDLIVVGGRRYKTQSYILEYNNQASINRDQNRPIFNLNTALGVYQVRVINFRGDKTFYTTFRADDAKAALIRHVGSNTETYVRVTGAGYDNLNALQINVEAPDQDGWLESLQLLRPSDAITLDIDVDDNSLPFEFFYPDFIPGVSPINFFDYVVNKDRGYLSFFAVPGQTYTFQPLNYDVVDMLGATIREVYTTVETPVFLSYVSEPAVINDVSITFAPAPQPGPLPFTGLTAAATLQEYTAKGLKPLVGQYGVYNTGWTVATTGPNVGNVTLLTGQVNAADAGKRIVIVPNTQSYYAFFFPRSPTITGPNYVYLRSNALSQNSNAFLTGFGVGKNADIIAKLPVNVAYLTSIEWDNSDGSFITLPGISTISQVDLRFTSRNLERELNEDTVLDWRGGAWSVSIEIVTATPV